MKTGAFLIGEGNAGNVEQCSAVPCSPMQSGTRALQWQGKGQERMLEETKRGRGQRAPHPVQQTVSWDYPVSRIRDYSTVLHVVTHSTVLYAEAKVPQRCTVALVPSAGARQWLAPLSDMHESDLQAVLFVQQRSAGADCGRELSPSFVGDGPALVGVCRPLQQAAKWRCNPPLHR